MILSLLLSVSALANPAYELGVNAIQSMQGCYLVDYSYAETESLKPGYERDGRVYDVNKDKSVKEWIYAIDAGANKIRLQHILFATDLAGNLFEGSELKHTAEDWEFEAPFLYDFTGPAHWAIKQLETGTGLWTRRITNLDDGLRYQCAAPWVANKYPEWSCANYAPIPGRETRDMGRNDYNTLDRFTRVVAYGTNWLERQENTKVIHDMESGVRTPLAKELGKNWYVRLPDSECASAQTFVTENRAFWDVMRAAWEEVLIGDRPFLERTTLGPARYMKIMGLQEQFPDLSRADKREELKQAILAVIRDFRNN
jgi:hypothetical protein